MAEAHGRATVIAIKEYGDTTYTVIANLTGDLGAGYTRDAVALDGHGVTIQRKVFDQMLKLPPITLQGNYDPSLGSHDELTGLAKWASVNEATTIEIRGPSYAPPSTDMVRASVQITEFKWNSPEADKYGFTAIADPDGTDFLVNGAQFAV